jgi:hypothetical protein
MLKRASRISLSAARHAATRERMLREASASISWQFAPSVAAKLSSLSNPAATDPFTAASASKQDALLSKDCNIGHKTSLRF